jgi:hypothetical protein
MGKMTKQQMASDMRPTGACWCGCGEGIPAGSYFARGHDKAAEAMLKKLLYGPTHTIAAFLASHGFGGHGKNLKKAAQAAEDGAAAVWARLRVSKGGA